MLLPPLTVRLENKHPDFAGDEVLMVFARLRPLSSPFAYKLPTKSLVGYRRVSLDARSGEVQVVLDDLRAARLSIVDDRGSRILVGSHEVATRRFRELGRLGLELGRLGRLGLGRLGGRLGGRRGRLGPVRLVAESG